MVGAITWSRIVSAMTTASTAPEAPIMWPVIDFVLLTASRLACSPNTRGMASGSNLVVHRRAGPVRIDVVAPLGFDLGLAQGPLHRQHGAVALGRCGHVES